MVLMAHDGWCGEGMGTTVTSTGSTDHTILTFREIEVACGCCSITYLLSAREDTYERIVEEEIQAPFTLAKKVKLVCNYSAPQLFTNSHLVRKSMRSNKILHTHRKRDRRNL